MNKKCFEPSLKPYFPHINLTRLPTPVRRMDSAGRIIGHSNLWMKCDQHTAVPYGGNKPRKLEFLLAEARGFRSIITTGGTGSNHCLATLIYGRKLDFDIHLILVPQPETPHVIHSRKLFHRLGARTYTACDYHEVPQIRDALLSKLPLPFFIPSGGSSAIGVLGFVEAALELSLQIRKGLCPEPRRVFIAAGTCGSMAGLVLGFKITGVQSIVTGIRVVDTAVTNPKTVISLIEQTTALMESSGYPEEIPRIDITDFEIWEQYFGKDYGCPTEAGDRASALIEESEGIQLEPTYTSKTMAAFLDYAAENTIEPVLFWNTFAGLGRAKKRIRRNHTGRPVDDRPELKQHPRRTPPVRENPLPAR